MKNTAINPLRDRCDSCGRIVEVEVKPAGGAR